MIDINALQSLQAVRRRLRQNTDPQSLAHQCQHRRHVVGLNPRVHRQARLIEQPVHLLAYAAVAPGEDDRVLGQLRQRHPAVATEAVVLRHECAQPVIEHRHEIQAMAEFGAHADTEVHCSGADLGVNALGHEVMQAHLDSGKALAKQAQGRRQGVGAHRGQGGEGDHAAPQGREIARAGDDVIQVQQQFFHGATGVAAGGGEAQMARAAVEEGDAQPIFQLLHLHGEGRGRQIQFVGGFNEAAQARHREEGLDMLD